MRPFNYLLLLFLAASLGFPVAGYAQAPGQVGNCRLGTSAQDLDVNNVRARIYNKGNLFFDGGDPQYEVPAGGGISPIFAGGIWVGGTIDGELRIAAATYAQFGQDYEWYPGPLNDDGTLPNPNDCSQFDRIYKVSRTDIANYAATGSATPDLAQWPVGLGAPTCVDTNENGRCDPEDERVEPTSRDQVIDLEAGQLPDIVGDQGLWWVMNDVGGPHLTTLSRPIGMEVNVLAFAFARADALGDATFYQYTFKYKPPAGQGALQNTWLTIFSDPDLGNYEDDYIGSDPEIGLGFVYNADDDDEVGAGGYGAAPPALGYDFFLGPTVQTENGLDTLQMTKFGYFNNNPDARTGNPSVATDYYNYMQGRWKDGSFWTEGGDGQGTSGNPVDYVYPNSGTASNPVPGYWSEVCPNTPSCGNPIPPADRRFIMSTGPFTMQPGETQVVTYGVVWARGSNNFASIQAMKAADVLAQRAFDLDFQLAPPPPAPDVEAATLSGQAALVWSYPETSSNYLGSYDEPDPLIAGLFGVVDSTYTFEGFNVYRYPNRNFNDNERELIAVYDRVNGITTVIDTTFNPEIGGLVPFVAARGEDRGVQFHHIITEPLINYQEYYYGVSAYAFNDESTPKVLESPTTKITVQPADVVSTGSQANVGFGEGVPSARVGGGGTSRIHVAVADPTQVTGSEYEVEIVEIEIDDAGTTAFTFRVVDVTLGEVKFDGVELYEQRGILVQPGDRGVIIDGLSFFQTVEPTLPQLDQDVVDPALAGEGGGLVEVSNPAGPTCEDAGNDQGCATAATDFFYGGNSVWLDPNSTGDYYVSTYPAPLLTGNGSLTISLRTVAPADLEIRFTEACATEGACLGVYSSPPNPGSGNKTIVSVPFELWNIGSNTPDDPSDDVRMIPVIRSNVAGQELANWANQFTATQANALDPEAPDVPVTEQIYWMMPDRPDGYERFAEAARGFGGPGASYDPTADGDDQNEGCARGGYYIDFCFGGAGAFVAPLQTMVFADLSGNGQTPPAGTAIRAVVIPKPLYVAGDRFTVDTRGLGFVTNDEEIAREAVERIGVVPNPYRGYSLYETNGIERRVRFINLPDRATIRIFTLGGTLIRTIEHRSGNNTDWDLETESGLPVASGMYLIHVETPNGDKVLKLGVVNRTSRFDI